MNYEQINAATENAISAMRAEVARGFLKSVSECWSFVSGYTQHQPIMAFQVYKAIMQLAKDGKISY